MSEETVLFGCIYGAQGGAGNWYAFYPLNNTVIQALPEKDEAPALVREMFTVPLGPPNNAFFRTQPIHFAASYNHFEDVRHQWILKFEDLLRRLYWFEAQVLINTEQWGKFYYHWKIAADEAEGFRRPTPQPASKWILTVRTIE